MRRPTHFDRASHGVGPGLKQIGGSPNLLVSRFAINFLRAYAQAMCGRFTRHLSWAEIHDLAGLIGEARNLQPRYNIAPTPPIKVMRRRLSGGKIKISIKRLYGEQSSE